MLTPCMLLNTFYCYLLALGDCLEMCRGVNMSFNNTDLTTLLPGFIPIFTLVLKHYSNVYQTQDPITDNILTGIRAVGIARSVISAC